MVIDNNPCFNDPSRLGMRVPSAATLAVLTGHGECSPSSTDPIPHPVLLITRNCLAAQRDPPLPKREVLVHLLGKCFQCSAQGNTLPTSTDGHSVEERSSFPHP